MSRLTKRNADGTAWYNHTAEREVKNGDILEKLAHYEDLEEAGRLIELPCELGTPVWTIMCGMTGKHPILLKQDFELGMFRYLGTAVFLTKAEAEAKLAELKDGE